MTNRGTIVWEIQRAVVEGSLVKNSLENLTISDIKFLANMIYDYICLDQTNGYYLYQHLQDIKRNIQPKGIRND